MTETEFLQRSEQVMGAIERAIDATGADIESTRSGNVLTLELGDGSKVVINSQTPMQQMWVAGRNGAFHYAWRDGACRHARRFGVVLGAVAAGVCAVGRSRGARTRLTVTQKIWSRTLSRWAFSSTGTVSSTPMLAMP
jgi:CyaY protein